MWELKNSELQSSYDKYKKGWFSNIELTTLVRQAWNLYKEAKTDEDKKILKQDMDEIKKLIDEYEWQKKTELLQAYNQVRGQLSTLESQVLSNQWKTDSREAFESNKKNYETLQQNEIEQIKNAFDLAFAQLEWLPNFSIKNKTEIKNKLNELKDGQNLYIQWPSIDWTSKTILDDLLKGFHDQFWWNDTIDKQAQDIVANLDSKLDSIVSNQKTNWVREFVGWIAGYEIKAGTDIAKKLDSFTYPIDWKTRADIENAIKNWRLVDITINTDKDWKKTYTYKEAIQKTPNAKWSLTIKETTEGKWEQNFSSLENALKNIDSKILVNWKETSVSQLLDLLKSGKSVSLKQIESWDYQATVTEWGKKLTISTLGNSIAWTPDSVDYSTLGSQITAEKIKAKIDADESLTAQQKAALNDFVKDLKVVKLARDYKISLGWKMYDVGTNLNLAIENWKVVVKSAEKWAGSGLSFKLEWKNVTQTTIVDRTEYKYENPSFSKYLEWKIDQRWVFDWTKLGISWTNLPKDYEALKASDKSLVIRETKENWKIVYKYSLEKRAYWPIYLLPLKEGSSTNQQRLWLLVDRNNLYSDGKQDLNTLVVSAPFVKRMQQVNNTIAYRDFVRLAQAWNYTEASKAIPALVNLPGLTVNTIAKLEPSDRRKLVDDTLVAAFGDESMVKNHFEIKLNHLKQQWLWNLVDDYQRIWAHFEQSSKETQINGLMIVLSIRNLLNKERTIIQQWFTSHTSALASDRIWTIPQNEFEWTKQKFLDTIQLNPEMKKNYIASRGLKWLSGVQAEQAWDAFTKWQSYTFEGKKYSIVKWSEKLSTFLVWICQNPGLKYDFDLQVETTTTTTGTGKPEVIIMKPETITRPVQNETPFSANFGLEGTPWTIPGTPGSNTPGQTNEYTPEETPGQPTFTTDTTYPSEIPGQPEVITPPNTTVTITIDHPTTPPYIPPVDRTPPEHPENRPVETQPGHDNGPITTPTTPNPWTTDEKPTPTPWPIDPTIPNLP